MISNSSSLVTWISLGMGVCSFLNWVHLVLATRKAHLCTQMQIDFLCGLWSNYHCWDRTCLYGSGLASGLHCPVFPESSSMPLAHWWILHVHFNCCWIETITCQEGRLLPGNPDCAGLSSLEGTWVKKVGRSRLHSSHLAQTSCEEIGCAS